MPLGLTAYCTLGKIFRWIEGKGQISYARKRWLTACDAACRRTYRPRGSIWVLPVGGAEATEHP